MPSRDDEAAMVDESLMLMAASKLEDQRSEIASLKKERDDWKREAARVRITGNETAGRTAVKLPIKKGQRSMSIQEDFLDYIEALAKRDTTLTPEAIQSLRAVYFSGAASALANLSEGISRSTFPTDPVLLALFTKIGAELRAYLDEKKGGG